MSQPHRHRTHPPPYPRSRSLPAMLHLLRLFRVRSLAEDGAGVRQRCGRGGVQVGRARCMGAGAAIRAGWGGRMANVRAGAALAYTLAGLTVPCRLAGCRVQVGRVLARRAISQMDPKSWQIFARI
ncbi:hypothetical protein B0H14DRAFT_3857993 [Mycena olivaceomarginata]|nr:hypothetical protein B0H14DRAFT_3857993 [Mycena olivaceomarginata]